MVQSSNGSTNGRTSAHAFGTKATAMQLHAEPYTIAVAWDEVFSAPVDYTAERLPPLSSELRAAIFACPPELQLPEGLVRQCSTQSAEQFDETAKLLARALTEAEPIRQAKRLAQAALRAATERHAVRLKKQIFQLQDDLEHTNRWQRIFPQARDVDAGDPWANWVYQAKTAVWLGILVAFVAFSAISLSRVVADAFGCQSGLEVASFCVPTALITFALGKIIFLRMKRPSERFFFWLRIAAIGIGLPVMIINATLIGLQQIDLTISLDENSAAVVPWYTHPSVRCISIAAVDFICVVCFTALYKHHVSQSISDRAVATPAYEVVNAAAGRTNNLLAQLDGLRALAEQVEQQLNADRESTLARLTNAYKAERWAVEAKIDKVLTEHLNS